MRKRSWEKLEQIDRTRYILRSSIIVLLVCLILYVIVLQTGSVIWHDIYRQEYSMSIVLFIAALIVEGFYLRSRFDKPSLQYHIAQYLMLGLFTILLTGFTPSIYLFWLAWLMLTAVFFGRRGLVMAITYMFIITLLTFVVDSDGNLQYLGSGITAATTTTIVAVTIALIAEYTGASKRLFERTKRESDLRQNRLLTTVNAVNEAIIGVDSNGYIQVHNPAAMILFDTNAKLEGKKLMRYLTVVDSKKRPFDLWKYIKKENRSFIREDLSLVFTDGDKIDLSISCAPVLEKYHHSGHDNVDKNEGYVLTLKDITSSKSLDEERDEFISVVSHELRTPVAVAEGALSNIQYLIDKEIDPKTLSAQLAVAHGQVFYLGQMINDIGTLNRAQRGIGAELEAINLRDFISSIEAQYTEQIETKGLKLVSSVADDMGEAYSSKLYLQEILQNLVTNAVKYTKKGTITITAIKTAEGALISVKDTGIGISKSDQKHIFEKFFRSEDFRTRETGGTGLGLYVVDKLATILGLKIKVESELDKGSTFSLTLPTDKPEGLKEADDKEAKT